MLKNFADGEKIPIFAAWESRTRPAPSEFPQDLTVARVGGRSGAM